mgnify:CR=1 FL=1
MTERIRAKCDGQRGQAVGCTPQLANCTVLAAWLLAMMGCCACEENGTMNGQPNPRGQNTPQAMLRKRHLALVEGDKEAFLDCYFPLPAEERDAAAAIFEFGQTLYKFNGRLREHYGPDAIRRFSKMPVDGATLRFRFPPADPDWTDQLVVSVDGDEAVVENPHGWPAPPSRLICVRGAWAVAEVTGVGMATPSEVVNQFQAWQEAVRTVMDLPGKPGYDLHAVKRALVWELRRIGGRA